MSTAAIGTEAMPPGELEAVQRVRQLEAMITQAQTGSSTAAQSPETQSFSARSRRPARRPRRSPTPAAPPRGPKASPRRTKR